MELKRKKQLTNHSERIFNNEVISKWFENYRKEGLFHLEDFVSNLQYIFLNFDIRSCQTC